MRPSFMPRQLVLVVLLISLSAGCERKAQPTGTWNMPFQITEQNGATALQLTNWTIVFEMIAAQPKMSGSNGVLTATNTEKRFGAVVVKQFHAKDGHIVSVNNQTFKMLDGGGRLMFSDRTYELKKGPKVVLVGKDGKTREP